HLSPPPTDTGIAPQPANRRSRTHSVSPCRTTKSLSLPTTPPFYLDSPNRRVDDTQPDPGVTRGRRQESGPQSYQSPGRFPGAGIPGTVKDSIDDDLERSDFVT